ncbi:MAG: aspartate aminotransferase, partial [Clostridia bacterium]|nr:aspartate aminotransferase [Clostridia bacterium]
MTYDFTSIMDRSGMDALALDGLGDGWAPPAPKDGFDAIPMWVADMNFATVPTVTEALMHRAAHPTYGYFETREEYFASILRWQ